MSTSFNLKCDVLLYTKWKKQGLELQINFNLGQVLQAPRWHSLQQLLDQAILLIWDHIIAKEKLSRFYKTKPFSFRFFFLFFNVWRPGRKTSGFQTVRILKIFRTSETDVMSGRALPKVMVLLLMEM